MLTHHTEKDIPFDDKSTHCQPQKCSSHWADTMLHTFLHARLSSSTECFHRQRKFHQCRSRSVAVSLKKTRYWTSGLFITGTRTVGRNNDKGMWWSCLKKDEMIGKQDRERMSQESAGVYSSCPSFQAASTSFQGYRFELWFWLLFNKAIATGMRNFDTKCDCCKTSSSNKIYFQENAGTFFPSKTAKSKGHPHHY